MKIYPNNNLTFGWNIRTHEYIAKKALQDNQYGLTSDEIELFLQNTSNVPKTLEGIKMDTFEDLLKYYINNRYLE